MVDEVWGEGKPLFQTLYARGPILLNRYIHPLERFCHPNPKFQIQVLTIRSEKQSDKSPCIWRGHRGRPCATESHPKGPWPKHWLLKSSVKTTILPPAHLWAGGNMKKVWLKAWWPVREGQTQMNIFLYVLLYNRRMWRHYNAIHLCCMSRGSGATTSHFWQTDGSLVCSVNYNYYFYCVLASPQVPAMS